MRRVTWVFVTGLLLASACGGSGDDSSSVPAPSTTTTAAASAASTTLGAPPPATPPAPKCTQTNQVPPGGFTRTDDPPTDFDGDAKPDAIYVRGSELFIAPSSGQGARITVPTAKPSYHLAGVDPDGDGDQEMFVSFGAADSIMVLVATFADCRVVFATNQQGEPFQFKVGKDERRWAGDGMGCTDADGDGRSDLVGLHYDRQGSTVRWTRTIVHLRDGRAINGKIDGGTFVSPQDDARIELLGEATCGERSQFLG
jgi:hypothetical protein